MTSCDAVFTRRSLDELLKLGIVAHVERGAMPTDDTAGSDAQFLRAARPFWHPVARSKDLDPGQTVPVTLLDEDLVLWRAPDGRLGLADDLCVHRGTRLSKGTVSDAGCVRCPYHGWEYDATGACTFIPQLPNGPIPAKARLTSHQVDEHAGIVWGCLVPPGEEARARPVFESTEVVGHYSYVGEVMDWACQSGRQIENFLDIAHFSVIHVDVFGNPDVLEVDHYDVARSDDGWQLSTHYDYPGIDPMAAMSGGEPSVAEIGFDYRVEIPFAVVLGSALGDLPYVLSIANQPVTAATSKLYWVMSVPEDKAMPDEVTEMSEQLVFHPDRAVVETQRPERLPIDLQAELHLPFDRLAVAYRRALGELGFPEHVPAPYAHLGS
jgi:phenylpropionate dioxygenase-like ring-hydroxylating dioxygenase large terminal subunit